MCGKVKVKAIPLQAWTCPEGSRRLKLPDFKTISTRRLLRSCADCQPYAPAYWALAPLSLRLGRTPLDESSARRIYLYLTTHNTREIHPCCRAGFEPDIPASQRPHTYLLDCAAIGIGCNIHTRQKYNFHQPSQN
jgi:hypothetical protein